MTDRCVHGGTVVRSELCGTPLSLIPIIYPIDCKTIPQPRCFVASGLVFLTQALANLEPVGPGFSESEIRRFGAFLRAVTFFACNEWAVIERPDLWVKAYDLSLVRNGENFAEIYIRLLGETL